MQNKINKNFYLFNSFFISNHIKYCFSKVDGLFYLRVEISNLYWQRFFFVFHCFHIWNWFKQSMRVQMCQLTSSLWKRFGIFRLLQFWCLDGSLQALVASLQAVVSGKKDDEDVHIELLRLNRKTTKKINKINLFIQYFESKKNISLLFYRKEC